VPSGACPRGTKLTPSTVEFGAIKSVPDQNSAEL
jgi:hypothetical protein